MWTSKFMLKKMKEKTCMACQEYSMGQFEHHKLWQVKAVWLMSDIMVYVKHSDIMFYVKQWMMS